MNDRSILNYYKLKATPCRLQVLQILLSTEHALAHADLENLLNDFDRVTVYRTLKSFADKGLVHKVLDDEGATKYALNHDYPTDSHDHEEHVHFKCQRCGRTKCIETVRIPDVTLPEGFRSSQKNLLIQGICQHCN